MTRVNVGIDPSELCDQMLLAELRELPRCFAYPEDHPRAPKTFTLGTGHVLHCSMYRGSLSDRHAALFREALHRGFSPKQYAHPLSGGWWWGEEREAQARPLLIARISERLTQMRREPRWTNATPPEWAQKALEARHAHA